MGYLLDVCWKECWWFRDILVTANHRSHTVNVFSVPHPTPPAIGQGMHKVGRAQSWDRWPQQTPHARHKGGGRRRKQEAFSGRISLPKPPLCIMEPCFQGGCWHLPAHGKWGMNPLFCFACTHSDFALPTKLCLSQPMSFLTLALLMLSHPLQGQWVSSCMQLCCQLGLNHDKVLT